MRIEYGQPDRETGFLAWLKRVGWFIALWFGGVVTVGVVAEVLKKIIFGSHA
ncbi:DUF2474 family protein [Gluconobacter morbifer]|uniref:DUF2474 domain-containing protein n=1 Tax=Gluconobacter morbifer G707 TaxID=1088869 RepID=G6XKU5_9PROT|nr:DUF2474 family protein [Gluconobacter morbifer]EHH67658.1 hypothetical protein GMO_21110 [Gluconobacter morbifer G707]